MKKALFSILSVINFAVSLFAQNVMFETRVLPHIANDSKLDKNSSLIFSREKLVGVNGNASSLLIIPAVFAKKLEQSPEKKARAARTLVGFGVGAAIGAVIGGVVNYRERTLYIVGGAFGLGILGGVVGAILGHASG